MALLSGSESKIERWFVDNRLIKPSEFTRQAGVFHDLLIEWSSRMNIVSKNDLGNLLERHILDSLTPLELISEAGRLIDIGSGGGFPGIPIALCRPNLSVTLLESRHKKALFLKEACKRLDLRNVAVEESRLEVFEPRELFDMAAIRALPQWEKHLKRIKAVLQPGGRILYYKKLGETEIISS